MKPPALLSVCLVLGLLAAGCSTVDSRIASNRDAFDSWPAAVQDKVVRGEVDLGFTADQVRVALGEPDRVFTRTTADGTSQVWTYREHRPRFSFGIGVGVGTFGSRGGSFSTVSIGTGAGYLDDEKLGVVIDTGGRVASIETRSQ